MATKRTFPLKMDLKGQGALKEQTHKHINGDQTRIKVLFGLTAELRIVEPCLFVDGSFIDSGHFLSQTGKNLTDFLLSCKEENKAIYYGLDSMTYVCQHTVVKERGKVTKSSLSIYVPVDVTKKRDLVCDDVTTKIPLRSRNALAEHCLAYTLSRV